MGLSWEGGRKGHLAPDTITTDIHLGSFGKGTVFKMAMEKFWIFVWGNYKI